MGQRKAAALVGPSNITLDRPAGSHSLAAAGQRDRDIHMDLRFIDSGWQAHFANAMRGVRSQVRWVSPFLQRKVIRDMLGSKRPRLRVLTRFSLGDFQAGVSDLGALELLLSLGAEVRGVRNLHAKVYLFVVLPGLEWVHV